MTVARVRIRCAKCRAVLKTATDVPPGTDPSTPVSFLRCRKCDVPEVRDLIGVLRRTGRNGLPLTGQTTVGAMSEPIAESIRRGGRRVDWLVRVVEPEADEEALT